MPRSFDLATNPHARPLPMHPVPWNEFLLKRDPKDAVRPLYTMRKPPRTDDMRMMLEDLGVAEANAVSFEAFTKELCRQMAAALGVPLALLAERVTPPTPRCFERYCRTNCDDGCKQP